MGCGALMLGCAGLTTTIALSVAAVLDQMHYHEKDKSPLSAGALPNGKDLHVPAAFQGLKKSATALDSGNQESLASARATIAKIVADGVFQEEAGGDFTWANLKAPEESKGWSTEGITNGYENPVWAIQTGSGKVAYGPDAFSETDACQLVAKEFVVQACNTWGNCDGIIAEKSLPSLYKGAAETARTWCVEGTADEHIKEAEAAAAEKAAQEAAEAEKKAQEAAAAEPTPAQ
jgi:hypothetical protein